MRGNWSEPITRTVTVEQKEGDTFRDFLYSTEFRVAVLIILIGFTMNFVGNHVLSESKER
ncbi:MAG: hypothetical protein ACOCTR_01070 [Candidatus Natronoplasma sp.]